MKKTTPIKPKPFDLDKHNKLYAERGWIHADDCVCKRRENQPDYVPVTIKPQKKKKSDISAAADVAEEELEKMADEVSEGFVQNPLFEPEEEEENPRFL